MDTSNDNIRKLFDMLDNPAAYSEQEISDIINCDEETRETYRLMVEAKRSSRWTQPQLSVDVDAAWQRFEQKHYTQQRPLHRWMHIAAIFIAAAFITGLSFAAYHAISTKQSAEAAKDSEPRMLGAFFVPKDCKNPIVKGRGDAITVKWTKGTWIQHDDDSFIEEHADGGGYMLHLKYNTIKLNGKELDIHNLPNLPASALKKLEKISDGEHHWQANLITTPVQRPANAKSNVNPNLTILLTGTVPKGAYQPVTIWESKGIKESYDWHDYFYTSWTEKWENIRMHLNEVVNRKDHHVRINVCKGVPQKHIDRIKNIMRECNVTNYEFVNQE